MLALLIVLAVQTGAQTPTPAAPGSLPVVVPKGTKIQLALASPVSSKANKAGDHLAFLVAEDVTDAQGHVIVPKDSHVDGEVTVVQGQPKIDHLRGLVGIRVNSVHLATGANIAVSIQPMDKDHGDFRTRETQNAPQAKPSEVLKYYASGQSTAAAKTVETVANNPGSQNVLVARGEGGGALGAAAAAASVNQDPFSENSSVILSQIVDFKGSQALMKSIDDTNLAGLIRTFSNHKQLADFTRHFSSTNLLGVVGAGVGLYKVACLGSSAFFKHCSLAPGAMFMAATTEDQTITANLPMVARDRWNPRRKLLAPHRFAGRKNMVFVPDGKAHMPKRIKH